MVKAGWIEDDNAEFIIPVFQKYTYNKSNPGVWIEILEDDNNHSPRTITDNTNDKESGQG